MNKAEVIKGIDMIVEGLSVFKKGLEDDVVATQDVVATPEVTADGEYSVEQLEGMKYNEFKKYAAKLGVKCTGTRDEIMKRIIDFRNGETPVEEEVAEEKPAPKKGRPAKKKEEPEVTKDEFDEQAEEILEETEVEEVIEALAEVGVKATKRTALAKLAQALRDGLIETDDEDEDDEEDDDVEEVEVEVVESDEDDDEEEDDDTDEDDSEDDDEDDEDEDEEDSEEVEIEADSYFSDYDPDGLNDPEDMTDERKEAVVAKMDEILTEISEGTLTADAIADYIEEHATQDEIDLLDEDYTDDELIMFYMELVKRTIDDDGEEHDKEDPYEINGRDICCGHELKYIKKTDKYVCEICGAEYESE